jgi:hypothetical protein
MANRVLQAKILKQKRRGKYKLRSGGDTVVVERVGPTPFTEDANGNTTTLKAVTVVTRVVRFTSQVINQGTNGVPRRRLYQEATEYLKNYHSNIPNRVD